MVGDSVYLMTDDGLLELKSEPYESEDILQELLAKYPDLLAGGQMNSDAPRRWLLVRRELGVPGGESEASRWSLDHLFIDQDGVPTLVEVKRSSDTRLRREVVGQMLDYAANGSKYWPPDSLRAEFEARCQLDGIDPNDALADHLAGGDPEPFWSAVADNLRTGRVRMVFLADVIPPELQRIIEFLNEQTVRSEVLGVEVRQYVGQAQRTFVPRVVGQTVAAQQMKTSQPKRTYAELIADADPATRQVESLLRKWAESHGLVQRISTAALQVLTPSGIGVLQFYPGWNCVEVPVKEARTGKLDERVDAFFEKLRVVSRRRRPSQKYPNVLCEDIAEAWETGARQLFDDWLDLISAAGDPGRTAFGYSG